MEADLTLLDDAKAIFQADGRPGIEAKEILDAAVLEGPWKRWVTRNALLKRGRRSAVGRLTSVKSGSASFSTVSSSS